MSKRAVLYLRVSDPSQIENNSLETQEELGKKFATNNDYEIVKIFKDEGISGTLTTRAAMGELLSYALDKKNDISAVIVYKLDRFSRNAEYGISTMALLARKGVQVLSVTEGVDDSPTGKAIASMLLVMAQLDNDLKGIRVRDNMLSMYRNGLWPFKCPVGYQRKYKTKEQNKGLPVILDPNLAPIVRRMFENAAKGIYTKAQLARMMNIEGFGDFYHTRADHKVVRNMLTKTFYYGEMYAKKWDEYVIGKHEPLIDKAIWQQAYNYLILRKKNFVYQDVNLYPLKGALKCGYCFQPMTTSPSRGGKGIIYYYECKNKKCRKLRINSANAHDQFIEILLQLQPSKRVIKLFQEIVFREWDRVIANSENLADELDNRIFKLRGQLRSIREAKDEGIYTKSQARQEADEIQAKLIPLEAERADIHIEQYTTEIVVEFTNKFLYDLSLFWSNLDLSKKQAFLQKVFNNSLICGVDKKIRTDNLSHAFEYIMQLSEENGKNVTLSIPNPNELINSIVDWFKTFSPEANQPSFVSTF